MKKIILFLILMAGLLTASTFNQNDDHENQKLIAEKMETVAASLKKLDIYWEHYSHIHYRDLHRIADQIEAGIVDSIMMATSFIPTPLSGVLFSYGVYLAAGSTVGHASNTAYKVWIKPVRELEDTFEKVRKFMENARVVEIFHEGRGKLSLWATLLIDSDEYFSGEETEAILLKFQEIEEYILLMGNDKVSKKDLQELCKQINKVLKYFTGVGFNFETLTVEYHNQKDPTQELLPGNSRWAVVFNGIASVWNINNELEAIESTEKQMRERQVRQRMADGIRDVAEKVREVCSRSPYCK